MQVNVSAVGGKCDNKNRTARTPASWQSAPESLARAVPPARDSRAGPRWCSAALPVGPAGRRPAQPQATRAARRAPPGACDFPRSGHGFELLRPPAVPAQPLPISEQPASCSISQQTARSRCSGE
eukprot:3702303-Prymnesium_polylepis.1